MDLRELLAADPEGKGPKPGFFDDPNVDRVLRLAITLAQELAVTRMRLDAGAQPGAAAAAAKPAAIVAKGAAAPAKSAPAAPKPPVKGKNEGKRLARERERAERDFETREAELKSVEAKLAEPGTYADAALTKDLLERYEVLRHDVDGLWKRLEELEGT